MAKKRLPRKAGGRHTTIIDAARPLVRAADDLAEVKNISLGAIKAGLHGRRNIKLIKINGGLLVIVRGTTTAQELRVYLYNVNKREYVREVLTRAFG